MDMTMKILIINQFSDNKGDRAILFYLLQQLSVIPDSQITVATSNPDSWNRTEQNGIKFINWAWNISVPFKIFQRIYSIWMHRLCYPALRTCILKDQACPWWIKLTSFSFYRAATQADLIISTGGHHFTNWFSKDGVAPIFYDLALAEMLNKKVVLWSQTIGPLSFSNPLNQKMVEKLMANAHRIVVRDEKSMEVLKPISLLPNRIVQTYDSVLGIKLDGIEHRPSREKIVGVSIYTGPERELSKEQYIKTMATFLNCILLRGYKVVFFPMQLKNKSGDDRGWISEIISKINSNGNIQVLDDDMPTLEHMQRVKDCSIFIGHKTHSIIFSLAVGTPLLAIAYHQKTLDIMAQYGLTINAIDENQISSEKLMTMFEKIEHETDSIAKVQMETSRKYADHINQTLISILK